MLIKLAAALDVPHETVCRLIAEDRQRYLEVWTAYVDTPVRPVVITSHVGGFCNGHTLPEGTTQAEAEAHTAEVARELNRSILLVFNRRLSISFDKEGNREKITEATPGDTALPYLQVGGTRRFTFQSGEAKTLNLPEMPGPQEVVTKFGGVQLRSSFETTQDQSGNVTFSIEGPFFELSDDEPSIAEWHNGLEVVLERHDVRLGLDQLARLRDSIDFDAMMGQYQIQQMLEKIEDELIARGVVQGPKQYQ